MNDEVRELLERQARWQKSRKALSWAEKVRLAEGIRESVIGLRRARGTAPTRGQAPGVNPLRGNDDEPA